jgi:hypothetical protein
VTILAGTNGANGTDGVAGATGIQEQRRHWSCWN